MRPRGWLRRMLGHRGAEGPGTTAELGRRGEDAAATHLRRAGYRVLARNIRIGSLEGDLLCRSPDGRTVVLVEVKARLRDPAGPVRSGSVAAEAAVGERKRRALRRLLELLVRRHRWEGMGRRIDVIAVEFAPGAGGPVSLRHIEGAVGEA